MKVSQETNETLVVDVRGGWTSVFMIPLFCLFLWLHWISFAALAPVWVHLIIGAFTVMIGLVILHGPERRQVVFDRNTGKVELRVRKGPRYQSQWFDISNVSGFDINPEGAGFATRPGPMERVYMYLTVDGGMDRGHYIVTHYGKSQHKTRTLVARANAWVAKGRA